MNQQEFKNESLAGVEEIGKGALKMINSLEKLIKNNYSKLDKDSAVKLAEMLIASKMDDRIKDFQKQIKDLQKDLK